MSHLQSSIQTALWKGIGIPFLTLCLLLFFLAWQVNQAIKLNRWVLLTESTISELRLLEKLCLDMETGVRGFYLARSQKFLEPYNKARARLDAQFLKLKIAFQSNPSQLERLATVSVAIKRWVEERGSHVNKGTDPPPYSFWESGKKEMDSARAAISEMISDEQRQKDARNERAVNSVHNSFFATVILAIVLGVVFFFTTSVLIKDVSQAYEKNFKNKEKAIQERERMVALASHDLRSPLNGIQLNAQALRRHFDLATPDTKKVRDCIRRIEKSTHRMHDLIADILDFSKIEAGIFAIAPELNSVEDLIDDLRDEFQLQAKQNNVDLAISSELPFADYVFDYSRLFQVLANLLGNALKFTPKGGTISMIFSERKAALCIEIRDTGHGIAGHEVDKIFDRFYQTKTSSRLGTGLGLFIAKKIVEAHRGQIGVISKQGMGSVFFITLPQKHLEKATTVLPVPTASPSGTLFLVDDDQISREITKELLTDAGYQIVDLTSCEDALKLIETRQLVPTMLLLDNRMPGMTGVECWTKLRQMSWPISEIPVIFMSGEHDLGIEMDGFTDSIPKPVMIDTLLAKITALSNGPIAFNKGGSGGSTRLQVPQTSDKPGSEPLV